MEHNYDFIIIGSGFGGSVSALRLSEKGYKVLVVEKGKWFQQDDFAKTNWNLPKWLWMPKLRLFGIMKISLFRHAAILSGTGVGGGSLVYANTLPMPKSAFYHTGSWSHLADWESELGPFYKKALIMLGATKNPSLFDGDLALKKLAVEIGREKYFEAPQVAVFFGKEGEEVSDPYFAGKGPTRAGCTFCGGCMTGCRHNAKNTLDKNYLYFAQKSGAKIWAESEVVDVVAINGLDGSTGYQVAVRSSTRYFKKNSTVTSKSVVFAGGVLGTVKLLLKLKKKSLPEISNKLGDDIRTNSETLISVTTLNTNLDMSKGVAIGSMVQTDENSHLEVVRYSEGSGFWKLLHLPLSTGSNTIMRLINMMGAFFKSAVSYFNIYWVNSWSKHTVVLLFMQHLDSKLRFKRNGLGWMVSSVSSGKKPSPNIPESVELTKKYASIVNGKATSFAVETFAGIPSTAHILGGAVMGKDFSTGVIDQDNRVFGYQNMWVVDGSMISANPGVNPSLSITAIAERAMDKIPVKK
ncbi:MAG: GMC oxidoreductase [Bacteroidales bacterium]|nr:GMC oxidoreductase [Bacteroidales bacterium]